VLVTSIIMVAVLQADWRSFADERPAAYINAPPPAAWRQRMAGPSRTQYGEHPAISWGAASHQACLTDAPAVLHSSHAAMTSLPKHIHVYCQQRLHSLTQPSATVGEWSRATRRLQSTLVWASPRMLTAVPPILQLPLIPA
jgi:hypothetical protein